MMLASIAPVDEMMVFVADSISPVKKLKNNNTHQIPIALKRKCASAVLFAELFATTAAIFAVTVVPTFSPKTIASA